MDRLNTLRRREFCAAATVAGLGMGLPAAASETVALNRRIRSCILVFCYGGPSHLETFDPKPNAPREIRGEYATIATAMPGIRVGEHLPRVARIMDRLTLVRSLHHPMRNHN